MAAANLPPIKIPTKILKDPELKRYFELLNFSLYQLWNRTGGGTDIIGGNNDQIEQNILDIASNGLLIDANASAILVNSGLIADNASDILDNSNDISALKETFSWKTIPSGEEVTIAVNQEMIVADGIVIDGSLIINGDLSLI